MSRYCKECCSDYKVMDYSEIVCPVCGSTNTIPCQGECDDLYDQVDLGYERDKFKES